MWQIDELYIYMFLCKTDVEGCVEVVLYILFVIHYKVITVPIK